MANRYAPDGTTLYLRKSAIEEFDWCPHRFYLTYIKGIEKEPDYKMVLGTRFHEFADWFFDNCQHYSIEQWPGLVPAAFTPIEQEWAKWFIEAETARYEELVAAGRSDEFIPVYREVPLEDNFRYLTGTCDRIDWMNKERGELCICEYKTGGSFRKASVVRQLAFYASIWNTSKGLGTITHMRYINPRLKMYETIPIKQTYFDKVSLAIYNVREALMTSYFPRKCNRVKYIFCQACTPDECGCFNDYIPKGTNINTGPTQGPE